MLKVNQLIGFGAGGFPPVVLLNTANAASSTSDLTTYTFSSQAIGTASSTRRVIVACAGDATTAGRSLSSATIGGISASINVQVTGGSSNVSAIISATVPTETTASVVLTFSGAMNRAACKVYAVDGLINTNPIDTATNTTAAGLTTSIDWRAGGFSIGVAGQNDGTSECTWVGLTEDQEISYDGTDASFASLLPTSSALAQTVSATWAPTSSRASLAVASYR